MEGEWRLGCPEEHLRGSTQIKWTLKEGLKKYNKEINMKIISFQEKKTKLKGWYFIVYWPTKTKLPSNEDEDLLKLKLADKICTISSKETDELLKIKKLADEICTISSTVDKIFYWPGEKPLNLANIICVFFGKVDIITQICLFYGNFTLKFVDRICRPAKTKFLLSRRVKKPGKLTYIIWSLLPHTQADLHCKKITTQQRKNRSEET